MTTLIQRFPLLSFYGLAYAITWSLAMPLLLARRGFIEADPSELLEPMAAFGPFIAAMLVARVLNGRAGPGQILASLKRWRVGTGWAVFAFLSPVLLLVLALLINNTAGGGEPADSARLTELLSMAGLVDLILIGGILQSWGEEPGWRGFATPTLRARLGPLAASLVLWPVWLCWHLPFFLSRPEFGWPQWIGFSVGILSAAIWLTLIWDKTRSVLMCIGWHAVVNICRGFALALSSVAFLAISNLVLAGALLIIVYWYWSGRRQAQRD
ncbi:MAG: CPBP family intramembrane glutamic endopeptidase [Gammaproteobacteria bacterium]